LLRVLDGRARVRSSPAEDWAVVCFEEEEALRAFVLRVFMVDVGDFDETWVQKKR
jgi:hypothetical protein